MKGQGSWPGAAAKSGVTSTRHASVSLRGADLAPGGCLGHNAVWRDVLRDPDVAADCRSAANNDPAVRGQLSLWLSVKAPWGDSFKSALQATAAGDYSSPDIPVNQASDIADQAVLASGVIDQGLWNAYRKCIADETCLSSES